MCLNGTDSRVRVGKHLSDVFPIWNGLKQGDALLSLFLNFALTYAIRKVQINQNALKLNSTHQLLVNTDDVTMLGGRVRNIKKHTEALLVGRKEIGLKVKVKAGKTKHMVTSRDVNAGRNHNVKIPSKGWKSSNIWKQL
jgi:hypothetical protein